MMFKSTAKLNKLIVIFAVLLALPSFPASGEQYPVGHIEPVPAIPARPEWNRFTILVWQYQTNVIKDLDLYTTLGLHGFHIDRGANAQELVEFSKKAGFPYYVDHAADKGILYLGDRWKANVTGKTGLATRPFSLADPQTVEKLKQHLEKNISVTKNGLVLAYAFDDEISLGYFSAPCDVDRHPYSIAWFRNWLKDKYGSIDRLNGQWESSFTTFDEVVPSWFDLVRGQMTSLPLRAWNFSAWMDFRQFMDDQFAMVLKELTLYANQLDPRIPAGFVGGQHPSPWGGYDYAKLSRVVQWMEAYDGYGTNEMLRSWWNEDRRPRMLTFFSTNNPKSDSWFLWYYLVHGNQGIIAWPEGWFRDDHDISPRILDLRETFKEIQGPLSEHIVHGKARFDADPIGIYYSHPSIQAGWAMDAVAHGKTWIKRSSSLDSENQTVGVLRDVWCKLLEDLGYQYDFISYLDVEEDRIDLAKKFRVIILPKIICLSDKEAQRLREFVRNGGVLIADNLCSVMDEHGKGRLTGALDDLFGIERNDSAGYLNGKGISEIDGEEYEQPFLKRFTHYAGSYRHQDIVVLERGTQKREGAQGCQVEGGVFALLSPKPSLLVENRAGKGQAHYLNLSFLEYWDHSKRCGEYGKAVRRIVGSILERAGLHPRLVVVENGHADAMIESIFWKNGAARYLCLIKNPSNNRPAAISSNGMEGIAGQETSIAMMFRDEVAGLKNLRTGKVFAGGREFEDRFSPWEANIYEME